MDCLLHLFQFHADGDGVLRRQRQGTGTFAGFVEPSGPSGLAARLTDHIVRKLAHFCEYMLEGFFLVLMTRVLAGRRRRLLPYLSWPALVGVLTALTDETIQLFFQGRGSRVTDVWIDFGGVVAGMLVGLVCLALLRALFGHRQQRTGMIIT